MCYMYFLHESITGVKFVPQYDSFTAYMLHNSLAIYLHEVAVKMVFIFIFCLFIFLTDLCSK